MKNGGAKIRKLSNVARMPKKVTKFKGVSSVGNLNKGKGTYHDPFMTYEQTVRQGPRT